MSVEVESAGRTNLLDPKEVVGEMVILSRETRSADCIALSDISVLRIDHDDFWDLLAEKPALSMGPIRVLLSRLYQRSKVKQQV